MTIIKKKDLDGNAYVQIDMSKVEFDDIAKAIEALFNSSDIGTYQRMRLAHIIEELSNAKEQGIA